MPRSSGTYSLPLPDVQTGEVISATWANTTLADVATALTNSLSKEGQTAPTANLPMGANLFTGVGNAAARNQYATAGQVQDGLSLIGSVAGTNTITGSLSIPVVGFATGMRFRFIPANTNTGPVTISVNGLSAKAITKHGASPLLGGNLVAGNPADILYDGTRFVLLNPAPDVLVIYKTANETVNNSETLQGDDHLSASLRANSKYSIELLLRLGTDGSYTTFFNAAFQCSFSVPTGASGYFGRPNSTAGSEYAAIDGEVVVNVDNAEQFYTLVGYVETLSAGTLQFRWSQEVAQAVNTILRTGSHMILRSLA